MYGVKWGMPAYEQAHEWSWISTLLYSIVVVLERMSGSY